MQYSYCPAGHGRTVNERRLWRRCRCRSVNSLSSLGRSCSGSGRGRGSDSDRGRGSAFNKLRQIKLWQLVASAARQTRGTHAESWQVAHIVVVLVNCLENHKINAPFWLVSFGLWMFATYPSTSTKMPSSPTAVTWPCCVVVVVVALTSTEKNAAAKRREEMKKIINK